MDKIYFYTGELIYLYFALAIVVFTLELICVVFMKTEFALWLSVMYATITYKSIVKHPIPKFIKDAWQDRLDELKKKNIRRYEQRFLEKYLSEVKIKPMETVFSE